MWRFIRTHFLIDSNCLLIYILHNSIKCKDPKIMTKIVLVSSRTGFSSCRLVYKCTDYKRLLFSVSFQLVLPSLTWVVRPFKWGLVLLSGGHQSPESVLKVDGSVYCLSKCYDVDVSDNYNLCPMMVCPMLFIWSVLFDMIPTLPNWFIQNIALGIERTDNSQLSSNW